jgi:hypothetical protein
LIRRALAAAAFAFAAALPVPSAGADDDSRRAAEDAPTPFAASQKDRLRDNQGRMRQWYMNSRLRVSQNGGTRLRTTAWSKDKQLGFRGGAVVFFVDDDGDYLWNTDMQVYQVSGAEGSTPKNAGRHAQRAPSEVLEDVQGVVIYHASNPSDQVQETLTDTAGDDDKEDEAEDILEELLDNDAEVIEAEKTAEKPPAPRRRRPRRRIPIPR